jgi:hypothetical protein
VTLAPPLVTLTGRPPIGSNLLGVRVPPTSWPTPGLRWRANRDRVLRFPKRCDGLPAKHSPVSNAMPHDREQRVDGGENPRKHGGEEKLGMGDLPWLKP